MRAKSKNPPLRRKVTITLPVNLLDSMQPRHISSYIEEAITEKRHREGNKGLLALRGSIDFKDLDWRKIRDEEWEDEKAKMKRQGILPPDWEEQKD